MNVRAAVALSAKRPREAQPEPETQPPFLKAMADLMALVLRSRARGLRWRLPTALILTVIGKAFDVLAPLAIGAGINRLVKGQGVEAQAALTFAGFVLGWTLVRFLSAAAPQIRDAIFEPVSMAAQQRAATEAFRHALSLSLDYHQTKRTGALSRTVDRGSRAVDFLLGILVFNLAPTALQLVLAASVLWGRFDWSLALIAVVTIGLYGFLTFAISDWRIRHRRELNEADSEAAGRAVDALMNYETIKSFGAEDRTAGEYERALDGYVTASVKATTSLSLLNTVQALVMGLGLGAMAILAGLKVMAGEMSPGDVTAVVLMLTGLYAPLNILGFAYRQIRQALIDMEAMDALRQVDPDVADAPDAQGLPPSDPKGAALAFEGVGFRHSARTAGLEEVSFVAEPGQTVAVVGPSGSGKTTLVRLALRLIDPQEGAIMLDGADLRSVRQSSLRRAIALVPQDVALFNDTLRVNVAFARPEATDEEVWGALEAAELSEFAAALPEGLDTKVGERGLKLSGGERQRVGLARALLADPRLLILDEATSALDSKTEAAIQETLKKARVGRTTLMVAHRLSTVADADQILVLKAGRIVERGTHAALVRKGGEYAGLWRRQTREKVEGSAG
ncbi:MAG: ABC transporter ATP-binding protein/permease [Proteobacteria bacterium]|nr:ABC transporter ATP-binding protein/permease [Pseudomonadota bacterium]